MALIPSESLNFPDNFRASVGWNVPEPIDKKTADSLAEQVPPGTPFAEPQKPDEAPAEVSGKSPDSPETIAEAAIAPGPDIDDGQMELIPKTPAETPSLTTDMDAVLNYFLAAGGKPEISNEQPNEAANAPGETGAITLEGPAAGASSDQETGNVVAPNEVSALPQTKVKSPANTPGQPPSAQQSIVAALESLAHTDIEAPIGSVEIKTPAQANHVFELIAAAVQRGALVGQTVEDPPVASVNDSPPAATTPPVASAPAPPPPPVAAPSPATVASGFSIASTPLVKSFVETDIVTPSAPAVKPPATPNIVRPIPPVTEPPVKQNVSGPAAPIVKTPPATSSVVKPISPVNEPSVKQDVVAPKVKPPLVTPPESVRPREPIIEPKPAPVAAAPDLILDPAAAAIESKTLSPVKPEGPKDLPPTVAESGSRTPVSSPESATQTAEKMPAKIRIQPRKNIKPRQAEPPSEPHPVAPTALADDLADIPQKPLTRFALEKKPGSQVATESKSNSPLPAPAENMEPRAELSARKIAAARLEQAPPDLFLGSARERRNRWIGFGLSELAVVTALILLGRFGFTHHFPDPTLKVLVFILLFAAAAVAIALPIAFFRNDPRRWQRANQ